MKQDYFFTQMRRVMETFGAENYPRARNEEIWLVVHDLPEYAFARVVSRIVGEVPIKYPPTVIQFREFAEAERKLLKEKQNLSIIMDRSTEKPTERVYESITEAVGEVQSYLSSYLAIESLTDDMRKNFKDHARLYYPCLSAEIGEIKDRMKEGDVGARAAYVARSKELIRKTTLQLALAKIGGLVGKDKQTTEREWSETS